ncbi:hypothetical protein KGM_204306 [Danaus plexippus plexippus]|uniref:Uncharacterized protein n=1 Tax=Danaus plexippus plexippus TaxID=278856 RepID=A0A212FIS9_DANPL|nr:hypothetical protein KGM_204306 [Danaus plexippus plexippus]
MDEMSKGMSQTGSTPATDKNEEIDGSPTPMVYVNESCLDCERIREACERLGTVAVVRSPDALPSLQQPPSPAAYLVTAPFDGDLFDAAHKAKYRCGRQAAVMRVRLGAFVVARGSPLRPCDLLFSALHSSRLFFDLT